MNHIGIYSGSFDPVHDGHVAFAREAIKQCGLDRVYFLVEPRPRRKQGVKALQHRQEMVRLAIAKEPTLGMIVVDQPQFTPDKTWPVLIRRFEGAKLHILLGDDAARRLADWPNVERLISETKFIVGLRTGQKASLSSTIKNLEKSRQIKLDYQVFQPSFWQYSSSSIRSEIKRGSLPDGLNSAVANYIYQQGLYRSH